MCGLRAKGAISAQAGQLGIIPGSMGAKSFIVRGKGNSDSFVPAPTALAANTAAQPHAIYLAKGFNRTNPPCGVPQG